MPQVPTNKMERELRRYYLMWLQGVSLDSTNLDDKLARFRRRSQELIEDLGGQAASLGALTGFPVPKTLELSPRVGTIYNEMHQAAISASITAGLNSRDAARAMFNAGMDRSYKKLERLARTETVSAYWKNSWDSIADLPAIVMVWGSEESKRTCDFCLSRDGLVVDDPNIRDHPNGRCTLIPTLRSRVKYKGTLQPDGSVAQDPRWSETHTQTVEPASVVSMPETPAAAQPGNLSNEDKINNAAVMFGAGSPQHKAAIKRFSGTPTKAKAGQTTYTAVAPDGTQLTRKSTREFRYVNLYLENGRWKISQMTNSKQSAENFADRLLKLGIKNVIVEPSRS